jgi:hypothetical protein
MHQMSISSNYASSEMLMLKNFEIGNATCIELKNPIEGAMTLNQISRKIGICMVEMILRFEMNL